MNRIYTCGNIDLIYAKPNRAYTSLHAILVKHLVLSYFYRATRTAQRQFLACFMYSAPRLQAISNSNSFNIRPKTCAYVHQTELVKRRLNVTFSTRLA